MEPQDLTQPIGDSSPADPAASGDETPVAGEPDAPLEEPTPHAPSAGQLRRERKRLWDERQETIYHVGGLAIELRRRGMLDEGLVARRADAVLEMDSRIVDIDGRLAEIDRERRRGRTRMPEPQGYCLSCGGPYLADSAFCSRCGARIQGQTDEGDTQVIPVAGTDGQ